jgi:hypothetical protein
MPRGQVPNRAHQPHDCSSHRGRCSKCWLDTFHFGPGPEVEQLMEPVPPGRCRCETCTGWIAVPPVTVMTLSRSGRGTPWLPPPDLGETL